MTTRAKPLFIALALALGASVPAFAQSSGDTGGNTNARTTPPASAPAQVTTPSGATVSGTADSTYKTQPAVVAPAPKSSTVSSEDARERAQRKATATKEEEHGGLRNRAKAKKERAREKAGLPRDKD